MNDGEQAVSIDEQYHHMQRMAYPLTHVKVLVGSQFLSSLVLDENELIMKEKQKVTSSIDRNMHRNRSALTVDMKYKNTHSANSGHIQLVSWGTETHWRGKIEIWGGDCSNHPLHRSALVF